MSQDTAGAVDLFGQPATPTRNTNGKGYTESNDMEIVQHVIVTALSEGGGYALTGTKPTVWHLAGNGEVEPVPSYEQAMVCQLLDRKVLNAGGARTYTRGGEAFRARSVLVPKATQSMARRWSALKSLPHQRGPAPVRSADTGKTPAGRGLYCPECGERAQRKKPTKWAPTHGPAPRYSHLDGEPLCPVVGAGGYEPAQPARSGPKTRKGR